MVSLQEQMNELGKKAKAAFASISLSTNEQRNKALQFSAKAIREHMRGILAANEEDVKKAESEGMSKAMLDRLTLNQSRIEAMAKGLEDIATLPDPLNKELAKTSRPNGLEITRVSVPLGVIGVIYESRPNVTADAGGLCIKSGNAVILRGGSDSFKSSSAILACLQEGLRESGLPADAVQRVPVSDREAVGMLLKMSDYVDVIVPRGGKGLIKRIIEESRIPTFQHLDGNCHSYVHQDADVDMAVEVILNAKMRRTGICGATESILVDKKVASQAIPKISEALIAKDCEVRGDEESRKLDSRILEASEQDWYEEYLDAIVSIKVVGGIDEAISHINKYGSHHTDAIITKNKAAAERFMNEVDSAIVLQNASTQFADGGEFGMGAEIGIATGRLHARGPVGIEQLCTFKYKVRGSGQVRQS
jgi:glutamate-5-semialdehyde dehydrogenase